MKKKDPTRNVEQLGNLLERYKKLFKPPQQSVVAEVVIVVGEVIGLQVLSTQFEYNVSSRIIYIKTPSVVRTEILKKKDSIKKALKERLGEHNSPIDFI